MGRVPRHGFLGTIFLLSSLLSSLVAPASGQNEASLGTLEVRKTVEEVTPDRWARIRLTMRNNGSIALSELEIYEYYNSNFELAGEAIVEYRGSRLTYPLGPAAPSGATQGQFIIVLPHPGELQPGEEVRLEYLALAPTSGDFFIPQSLVWYSYLYVATKNRVSIYSNALLVHIPNQYEKIVMQAFPYAVAVATFLISITTIIKVRRYFV